MQVQVRFSLRDPTPPRTRARPGAVRRNSRAPVRTPLRSSPNGAESASLVIRHTHRLPVPQGSVGEGTAAARQFDAALMDVGFKLSAELLERLSGLSEAAVVHTARRTLRTVSEMAATTSGTTPTSSTSRRTCRTPRSSDAVRGEGARRREVPRERADAAGARGAGPAHPPHVRPLPAHLRGAARGAGRADRLGGRPGDRAASRRGAGRRTHRPVPGPGRQHDPAGRGPSA